MNTKRRNLKYVTPYSLALVTGLIFCCGTSSAQDRDQLQASWRKKVGQESRQFFSWFKSHITGSSSTNTMELLLNGGREKIKLHEVLKRKDSFYILSSEALNASPRADNSCYGINSKYAFWLKKAKNGKDWVVQSVVDVTPDFDDKNLGVNLSIFDPATLEKYHGFRGVVNHGFDKNKFAMRLIQSNSPVGSPRSVDPWKIEDLPGFLLHSISTDGQSPERYQLNFEYQVEDAKRKNIGVVNCNVFFDIKPICYPVESHQVMKNGDEETVFDWSNVVKRNSEKEYEVKYFSRLKKTKNAVVTQFVESQEETVLSLNDPPESDFTLSAFGLPEPPGVEWKKPFPWYLVLAAVGTACLGIFFFLRSRAQRESGAA